MVTEMIADDSSLPYDSSSYQRFVHDYLEDTPMKPYSTQKSDHSTTGESIHIGNILKPKKPVQRDRPDFSGAGEDRATDSHFDSDFKGRRILSESEFTYEQSEDDDEFDHRIDAFEMDDEGPILDDEFRQMVNELDNEGITEYPQETKMREGNGDNQQRSSSYLRPTTPAEVEEPTYHIQLEDADLEELDIPQDDNHENEQEALDELTPQHFPHLSRIEGFTAFTLDESIAIQSDDVQEDHQTAMKPASRNNATDKHSELIRQIHTPRVDDDESTVDDDGMSSSQGRQHHNVAPITPSHAATATSSTPTPANSHLNLINMTPSSSQDMLLSTIKECQSLRNLNETMLIRNKDLEKQIEILSLERDKEVLEMQKSSERKMQKLKDTFHSQKAEMEHHIKELERALDETRSAKAQMGSLKLSLQREQDLNLLTIKKELLAQKEKQLYELRREMGIQKEQMIHDLEEQHSEIRARLEGERDSYKKQVQESEYRLEDLQDRLNQALKSKVVETCDEGTQVNESSAEERELKNKEIELDYIKEQLFALFSDTPPSKNTLKSSRGPQVSTDSSAPPTTAKLLELCRSYIERTEHAAIRLRLDLESKNEQLANQESAFSDRLHSEKEALEFQHQKELAALKRAHTTEKDMMKSSLESQLKLAHDEAAMRSDQFEARLEDQKKYYEEKLARRSTSQPSGSLSNNEFSRSLSIRELLARYPLQLGTYRSSLESSFKKHLQEKEAEQKRQVEQLLQEHASTMREMTDRTESQKQLLVEKHNADIREISVKLKDQCAVAYEKAISKLKAEYVKLEQQLKERYDTKEKQSVNHIKSLNNREIDALKSRLSQYSERAKEAEAELKQVKEKSSHELSMIKEKYISTLKKMRDDLAANKQASWERLESEWIKRKQLLNEEWVKRLQGLREHCEAFHTKCHCPNLISWSLNDKAPSQSSRLDRSIGPKRHETYHSTTKHDRRKLPDPHDWEQSSEDGFKQRDHYKYN